MSPDLIFKDVSAPGWPPTFSAESGPVTFWLERDWDYIAGDGPAAESWLFGADHADGRKWWGPGSDTRSAAEAACLQAARGATMDAAGWEGQA